MEKTGEIIPPSYEESTRQPCEAGSSSKATRGQQIIDQLTVVRSQHVLSVVEQHVVPIVEQQARYGMSKTVLILLPSDIVLPGEEVEKSGIHQLRGKDGTFDMDANVDLDAMNKTSKIEIVGFASDEEIEQIRLEGAMNRISFWRQRDVIQTFGRALQERLSTIPELQPTIQQSPVIEASVNERPKKKSLFGRFSGQSSNASSQPIATTSDMLAPAEKLLVDVHLEELCLRTESEFGLYDTINRQAIVIKVDAKI
jgi:hypothetical protein